MIRKLMLLRQRYGAARPPAEAGNGLVETSLRNNGNGCKVIKENLAFGQTLIQNVRVTSRR